jgi:hypothetical protein
MQLEKWPESQLEYWQAINTVTEHIRDLLDNLSRGNIDDLDGSATEKIKKGFETLEKLKTDLVQKFRIAHPTMDVARIEPDLRDYWEWDREMKLLAANK